MQRTSITLSKYADNFVEFQYTGWAEGLANVHRIGVDESGRATYKFGLPNIIDEDGDTRSFIVEDYLSGLTLPNLKLTSEKKEWTKSTIDGLLKVLSETCKEIGVPAPAKLLEALANATELVVTFHNFDGEFQILEAGKESKMADGSDDEDDDDDDE